MAKFNDAKWRREQLDEGLSHDDAYNMLDIAAQFTSNAHVAASQRWYDAQDLYDYIKSDHIRNPRDRKLFYKRVKKEFPMVKEAITKGPSSGDVWGWEMVRALNSLGNDLKDTKHKKMMAWAAKNERKAKEIIKTCEELKKLVYKMR